ncbi:hypothetical protein T08_15422 [Trichinella sp. T8]|nr:hypothetical protein T08_15422 [Trichinella sp. T8]
MCLIERSRRSLSRRAQYASALCRSLGMDEWLIRKPVKREVAEMESQKGSTAGDSDVVATGISTKADEELIDLSEDYSFKMSFDRKRLIQFWLSVQNTYPTLSTAALKLQLSNNLRLKLTHISVDVEEVISQNRK